MEKELQKEGAWAPRTPAKQVPARTGLGSFTGEWNNHLGGSFQHGNLQEFLNFDDMVSVDTKIGLDWDDALASSRKETWNRLGLDLNKSIPSFEGGGSRETFAEEDVMAGKFSKENLNGAYACNSSSSNSEESVGAKSSEAGISGLASALHDCEVTLDALKNISFKELLRSPDCIDLKSTSASSLSPPLNAQYTANQSIPRNSIKIPAIPPPKNSPAADQAVRRHSIEIPPTPPPNQATCQAIPRNSYEIPPTPPPMNAQTQAAHQATPRNSFQIPASHQHEDLNKKPRQQRLRMKKHRPKVMSEGKPKKAPKSQSPKAPKTPKNVTPKHAGSVRSVAAKLCKRVLNFNLKDEEEYLRAKDLGKNIKKGSGHAAEDGIGVGVGVVVSSVDLSDQEEFAEEGVPLVELPDPEFAERVRLVDLSDPPEVNLDDLIWKTATSKRSVRVRKRYSNCFAPSANLHKQPNEIIETCEKDVRKIVHQYQRRKKGNFNSNVGVQDSGVSTAITFAESIPESKEQLVGDSITESKEQMVGNIDSVRVYKRRFQDGQCQTNSRKLGPNFPRIYKKPRIWRQKVTTVETLWSIIAAETGEKQVRKEQDGHKQATTGRQLARKSNRKRIHKGVQKSKAYRKAGTSGSNYQFNRRFLERISPTKEQTRAAINDQESFKCVLSLCPKAVSWKKRSKVRRQILPSPTAVNPDIDQYPSAVVNPNHDHFSSADLGIVILPSPTVNPSCPQFSSPSVQDLGIHSIDNAVTKSGRKRSKVFTHTPNVQNRMEFSLDNAVAAVYSSQKNISLDIEKCTPNQAVFVADIEDCIPNHQHVLRTNESASRSFVRGLTDHIIQRLEALHINDECMQLVVRDQNVHGALVKFDPPKKRKNVPKVDLDDETLRVWKLLMENEGSEPFDDMDKDKEEWWEKQREIFRGRIDSFIARMHLIQGDRRFSPWKGSVVDSIVGVYLTQNVSDHLSSSAFMSLAAKFPSKSTSNDSETGEVEVIICSQESVGSSVEADGQVYDKSVREQEKGYQSADIIRDETPATKSGQTISDAIPGQTLEGTFHDGSLTTNDKPYFGERQHLDEDAQKLYSVVPFDLNVALWDPLGILGSDNRADRKKKPKREHSNASLGKRHVTAMQAEVTTVEYLRNQRGRNGEVKGKKAETTPRKKKSNVEDKPEIKIDWDELRKTYGKCRERESGRNSYNRDSVDWEAVRCSTVDEIAKTIKERGMNNVLAKRIKDFLDRIYKDHGSLDLEWLRDVPPDKAKEYLLSIDGIGLKSVECVRLLTLHHLAFPVDTNVARVAVRLGWVPLQPLPEEVQLHLLNAYPLMDSVQKYLWPRLRTLSQPELYELHYQMITFGKVFCTMRKPNCNSCPMRGECRHYASAFASARLGLPRPEEKKSKQTSNVTVTADQNPSVVVTPATTLSLLEFKISDSSSYWEDKKCESIVGSNVPVAADQNPSVVVTPATALSLQEINISDASSYRDDQNCQPIIEVPPSPGPVQTETLLESDNEDLFIESDEDEIPTIRLNTDEFRENLRNIIDKSNFFVQGGDMSRALVALTSEAASFRVPQLKHVSRLKTVHQVYELPDSHPLLAGFERREPDDPSPYLLAIWTTATGETVESERRSENSCSSSCTTIQELNSESAWGTILIPCRTATRGSFPLNGTYFQVNEVFADDESSRDPIRVPREWIWSLHRRTLHCGTSATSIFRGLPTEEIQYCFWRGFICVRGFNKTTRIPRRLAERFHLNTTAGLAKAKARDDE